MIQDKKGKIPNWFKEHKKETIVATGIVITSSLVGILGIKNRDVLLDLLSQAKSKMDEYTTPLYGSKWVTRASDDELREARKMFNTEYGKTGDSFAFSMRNRIDSEMSKRAWGDVKPHPPTYSREHGYNLYKPD